MRPKTVIGVDWTDVTGGGWRPQQGNSELLAAEIVLRGRVNSLSLSTRLPDPSKNKNILPSPGIFQEITLLSTNHS